MSTKRNLLMWIEKDIKDPGIKDVFDTFGFLGASAGLITIGIKIFPSYSQLIIIPSVEDRLLISYCIISSITIIGVAWLLAYASIYRFMILSLNLVMANDPDADFELHLNRTTWQFIRDYPKNFLGSIFILLLTIPSLIILLLKIISLSITHK